MIRTFAAGLLAALLLATGARAETTPSTPLSPTAAASAPRLGWANIGIYDVRFSTPFGDFTDAEFGIGAGAAVNVGMLSPDVPLAVFGNAAIAFASGGQFFPLTGGVAIRYDKLPVHFLGGLGLTLLPNSAGTDTGIGAGLLLMGLYPLQQVDPRLSLQAQLQYHLLNHSMSLFELVIGAGYAL